MKILFLQKPEAFTSQREQVSSALASLDGVQVRMASTVSEALRVQDTEVLICPTLPWLPEVVEHLPRLEWIHFLSAGVDRIWDMPFDKTRYALSKSTGVHADTISEYVIGAILYSLKGFGIFERQQRRREWRRLHLDECAGKTLSIIGLGTIGQRLAELAKAHGLRVIGTVKTPRDLPNVDAVYSSEDLHQVLREGDFVVILAPLTPETRGLIDARAFAAMKPTAWFINVARGEIVEESALVTALRDGRIAGAVLDVFENEPLPGSSPLWMLENVLITPHVAGTTQHYMDRALNVFCANYRRFITCGELETPVDVTRRY